MTTISYSLPETCCGRWRGRAGTQLPAAPDAHWRAWTGHESNGLRSRLVTEKRASGRHLEYGAALEAGRYPAGRSGPTLPGGMLFEQFGTGGHDIAITDYGFNMMRLQAVKQVDV